MQMNDIKWTKRKRARERWLLNKNETYGFSLSLKQNKQMKQLNVVWLGIVHNTFYPYSLEILQCNRVTSFLLYLCHQLHLLNTVISYVYICVLHSYKCFEQFHSQLCIMYYFNWMAIYHQGRRMMSIKGSKAACTQKKRMKKMNRYHI